MEANKKIASVEALNYVQKNSSLNQQIDPEIDSAKKVV